MTQSSVNCPQCGSWQIAEPVAGTLNCRDCHHYFDGTLALIPPSTPEPRSIHKPKRVSSSEQIRCLAKRFETAALLFVVGGIVALVIFGFSLSEASGPFMVLVWLCVGFFTSALWFYVIAQIIHIRANTEK